MSIRWDEDDPSNPSGAQRGKLGLGSNGQFRSHKFWLPLALTTMYGDACDRVPGSSPSRPLPACRGRLRFEMKRRRRAEHWPRWLVATILVGTGWGLTACSSSRAMPPANRMAPAAEPATSPGLVAVPTGAVTPVGPRAEGVAVDPSTGVVAVGREDGVVLMDEAGHVLANVDLASGPRHVGLVAPGGPFIVPEEGSHQIALVEEPSGHVSALVRVGVNPHDIVVAADRVFVGNEGSNTMSVVHQDRVLATLPVVTQPGGLAVVGPYVAVVGVRSRRLELIDAQTLHRVASVPVEKGPSHVAAAGSRLYVVDTGGTHVRVFETRPRLHQIGSLTVPPSPLGVAVDTRQDVLWVSCTSGNRLVELSLKANLPKIAAMFPTVRQPNTVAVDPVTNTVFVAGEQAGVLQILHPSASSGG